MDYESFTLTAAERAGMTSDAMDLIERATLQTLAERISGGETRDLASQLPKPLQQELMGADEPAEPFDVDEFVRRVAVRAGVTRDEAWTGAAATLNTLRDAVTPGEFDDVLSQLPKEYGELVAAMA
jgi:uncharacterized protein (DUF2267 family)